MESKTGFVETTVGAAAAVASLKLQTADAVSFY